MCAMPRMGWLATGSVAMTPPCAYASSFARTMSSSGWRTGGNGSGGSGGAGNNDTGCSAAATAASGRGRFCGGSWVGAAASGAAVRLPGSVIPAQARRGRDQKNGRRKDVDGAVGAVGCGLVQQEGCARAVSRSRAAVTRPSRPESS